MAFTYDLASNTGKVRLLIPDNNQEDYLLSDAEILAALGMSGDSVYRAAALCLEIIASSEAMIDRKIKSDNVQTDGPALAAELRARARSLREQAETESSTGLTFVFPNERMIKGL